MMISLVTGTTINGDPLVNGYCDVGRSTTLAAPQRLLAVHRAHLAKESIFPARGVRFESCDAGLRYALLSNTLSVSPALFYVTFAHPFVEHIERRFGEGSVVDVRVDLDPACRAK